MDYPRLQVFLAVAQHVSFSQAAEALHLSQPAVSRHIQILEAELGVVLFQRQGNRVELTDAGRILVDYAQRVLVLTDEVKRVLGELDGLKRGYLRLGASGTPGLYILPEIVARFQDKYPGIEASLLIANSSEVVRRLLSGELDLGFIGRQVEVPGLQVRPFAEDEITLITPPGHAFNQQAPDAPADWATETLIVREFGSATRQLAEAHLVQLGIKPKRTLEIAGCEGVKRAVAAGLGVAFVSRRAIELELAQNRICALDSPTHTIVRQLYVITRKDARPIVSALAFLALVTKKGV